MIIAIAEPEASSYQAMPGIMGADSQLGFGFGLVVNSQYALV